MRISAINGYYNVNNKQKVNPNFNGLIKDRAALPIIDSMSQSDIEEFIKVKNRLANTKFWDMKISSIGNKFNEFKFQFINKKDPSNIITDGIFPYDRLGNRIRFYTVVYGPENTSSNTLGNLDFKTEARAEELYDKYHQNTLYMRNRGYNITPIESLKMKELELTMLEEASDCSSIKREKDIFTTEYQTKGTVGNDLDCKRTVGLRRKNRDFD